MICVDEDKYASLPRRREPSFWCKTERGKAEYHLGAGFPNTSKKARERPLSRRPLMWEEVVGFADKKSGTAEVFAFVSFVRQGRFYFANQKFT